MAYEGKGAGDGGRDGDGGDERGAPVAQEEQDDERRQEGAHDQVLLTVLTES
jgi:hypothetical protein